MALLELGMLEDTLFSLEWFQDPQLRRRTQIGLNKGEAANTLKRSVLLHRKGKIHDSSFQDQNYRASGLNLISAAIVLWNTVYISKVVEELQKEGIELSETQLKHVGPLGWDHITLTGEYFWNSSQWTSLNNLRPVQVRPELFRNQRVVDSDAAHMVQ